MEGLLQDLGGVLRLAAVTLRGAPALCGGDAVWLSRVF